MIRIGSVCFVVGLLLVFAPLLLPRWSIDRFIVVIGMLCSVIGASLLLHGTWDVIRAQDKQQNR